MDTFRMPGKTTFKPMTEACARDVLSWHYEPPYDLYNLDSSKHDAVIRDSYLNPAFHYYSVHDEKDALIAFRCFGEDARVPGGDYGADALDMGGGLRPDLTGHGLGPQIMRAAMDFARTQFSPRAFRVTVAEFNLRAQCACEKVGYVLVQRFVATQSKAPFLIYIRNA